MNLLILSAWLGDSFAYMVLEVQEQIILQRSRTERCNYETVSDPQDPWDNCICTSMNGWFLWFPWKFNYTIVHGSYCWWLKSQTMVPWIRDGVQHVIQLAPLPSKLPQDRLVVLCGKSSHAVLRWTKTRSHLTWDFQLVLDVSWCLFVYLFTFFKFQGLHECIVCVSYEEKHILSPPNPGNSRESGWHPNKDSSRIRGRFLKAYTVRGTFSNPHLGSEDSHESWVEAGFVNPPQYGCFQK